MSNISSEAMKAGLQEPTKPIEEMTEQEVKDFRNSFDADFMGFDGVEGIEEIETTEKEETEGKQDGGIEN